MEWNFHLPVICLHLKYFRFSISTQRVASTKCFAWPLNWCNCNCNGFTIFCVPAMLCPCHLSILPNFVSCFPNRWLGKLLLIGEGLQVTLTLSAMLKCGWNGKQLHMSRKSLFNTYKIVVDLGPYVTGVLLKLAALSTSFPCYSSMNI
jgi:hypothetical protein